MNNINLTVWLFFLFTGSLYAQTFEIAGKVVDNDNVAIPFANILLLNSQDSTFVKGTSADDKGLFLLEDISPDLYLLQASYVGRGSKPLALDIKESIALGALIIPNAVESLDEVVVTARKPVLQRLADRLVFQVENTVVSQGSSWDILRSTPGVIVNQEELQIRGRLASIYLNGRKVQLSDTEIKDFLQNLSGNLIKSIEMYNNAPANFDAESGAVVNIITTTKVNPGYKGSINGTYTQAIFPKYSLGTSHFYKTGKFNFFANYNYSPRKELRRIDKGVNFFDTNDSVFSRWNTSEEETLTSDAHAINTTIDFDIDNNDKLNLTSNLLFNQNQNWERIVDATLKNAQNQLDSTFVTANNSNRDKTNLAFDLSYEHSFDKLGAKLKANVHYTNFNEETEQQIVSSYFNDNNVFIRDFGFRTDADQQIDIFTGQIDFLTTFGMASLETGVKASVIDSRSAINFADFIGSDESVDASLSDDFLYDEKVFAAYVSYVKNWEKWSVKLGLRGEYTDALGTSLALGEANTQNFFEPFPSVYLVYTPSENHSFSLDYGRKLQRPRYNDLNPFRVFLNENDFLEGNPTLQPNFRNEFNINYSLNGEFFFDIYYRDNGNYISELSFQDNERQTVRELRQNVSSASSFGLDFTVSKSIANPWFLYAYISIFREDNTFFAVESNNQPVTIDVDGYYVYLANYLTLSSDGSWTGELAFTHFSNFIFGSFIQGPTTDLKIGLRKSLWKNRAVISVTAEDLLGNANATYSSRYLNQDNFYFTQPETQFIRVGFTYNFGNFRLEDNKKDIEKKERDRLLEGEQN